MTSSLKCPECEYTTPYKNILSRHINKYHNTNISPTKKCPMCDKLFSRVATCKKHIERNVCMTQENEKDPYPSPSMNTQSEIQPIPPTPRAPQRDPSPPLPNLETLSESSTVTPKPLKSKPNYFKYMAAGVILVIGNVFYGTIRKKSR